MDPKLKAEWQALRRAQPGHRFQNRYAASRRAANRRTTWSRIVRMIIAVVSLAAGVVLMFIPGPAILFFIIAGGFLAGESKLVARFLDWSELRIRAALRWAAGVWKRSPVPARIAIVAAIALVAGGAAYFAWRLFLA